MSADLLFEIFATLATAPEGIPRLRDLILQLAVQGKLGTQDEGDEPASVLQKRIQKDKLALIEKRKLRENRITEMKEIKDMQYPIPPNWSWYRMGEVVFFQEGPGIRNWQFRTNGVKLLNVSNILSNGQLELNNSNKFVSVEEVKEKYSQFLIEENDLLLASSGGSWGKTAWFVDPGYPIILNTSTVRLRFYSEKFSERYLQYFMKTMFFRNQMVIQLVGMQPNFGSTHLSRCYIPLPPLTEQNRIVAKVDRLMALCDELEARQQQERAGCLRLGTASLTALQNAESPEEFGRQWAQVCEAFELIFDCPENVGTLRQTILQLALQGRMNTQEPKDEPADKLFSRIKIEQERRTHTKGKPIVIRPLDNPELHAIPERWIWIRLGDILADIRYGTSEKSDPHFKGIPVIRIPNIGNGIINFNDMKYLQKEDEIDNHKIENGDLLTIRSNGSRDLVGKCAVIKNINRPVAFASYLIRLRPILVNPEFLALALSSQNVRDQFFSSAKTTSGVHNINSEELARTMLALPPLAEQHRIVARVDALMALCDELEARLKERAAVQGRLAGSIVKGMTV